MYSSATLNENAYVIQATQNDQAGYINKICLKCKSYVDSDPPVQSIVTVQQKKDCSDSLALKTSITAPLLAPFDYNSVIPDVVIDPFSDFFDMSDDRYDCINYSC